MATQVQIRRGTSAQVAAFTGAEGEIVVNTTNDSIHVNDGSSAGGFEMARVDGSNWNVTNNTLVVDTTNNRVGIGISSPADALHVLGSSGNAYASIGRGTQSQGEVGLRLRGGTSGNDWYVYQKTSSNNLNFYNTADRVTIDSSGNTFLQTGGAALQWQNGYQTITGDAASNDLTYRTYQDHIWKNTTGASSTTDGTERLRLNQSGNLGLGLVPNTWSVGRALELGFEGNALWGNAADEVIVVQNAYYNSGWKYATTRPATHYSQYNGGHRWFTAPSGTADAALSWTQAMTLSSSGSVGIGTSSPNSVAKLQVEDITASNTSTYISVVSGNGGNAGIIFGDSDSDLRGGVLYNNADNALRFFGKNAFSEAGRFDVNGNFLVGGTDTDPGSTGNSANAGTAIGASGYVSVARTGGSAIRAGRIDSQGAIIEFFGDGSLIGSIGTETSNSDLYIGNGDTAIMFHDGADAIFPHNASTNAGRDAAIDIGYSAYRFKDAYIRDGVTTGSDSRDKQDIEELSDAEQRVAVACKGLLRKWRWKDSVESKGDDARIHFGIIAQDLQDAFTAEGLDAGRYAMFINSTWTDEETGEERSRMGVRYSELLAFIIAAI